MACSSGSTTCERVPSAGLTRRAPLMAASMILGDSPVSNVGRLMPTSSTPLQQLHGLLRGNLALGQLVQDAVALLVAELGRLRPQLESHLRDDLGQPGTQRRMG